MNRNIFVSAASAALLLSSAYAHAEKFSTTLSGFEEIGGLGAGETGAILSDGAATLDLDLNRGAQTLTFTLRLNGGFTTPVTQSHIHFGKVHVAGGIIVFFCSNLPNPPAGTQACPTSTGTVTGTIHAADVVGPTGQNVSAGDFDALADALESNTAYANVHTMKFPAGEIRGQIHRGDRDDDNR